MSAAGDPFADLTRLQGVGSAVGASRDAVDAVLTDRGRRRVTAAQSATALLTAARASASLQSAGDDPVDRDPGGIDHDQWELSTIRLYTELVELSRLIRTAPGQVMARAHALLCRGLIADVDLGRIRDAAGVGERLSTLSRSLAAPTAAPTIVVAGIAHAELITAGPFATGNGVIARAVERMILVAGDVDAPAVTVPEVGYLQAGADYWSALDRYRQGGAVGVRDWLLFVAEVVARGAELSPVKPVR